MASKRIMLYLCDPEKNTECKKTYCKFRTLCGECDSTSKEEYAKHDVYGKPIVMFDSDVAQKYLICEKE